MREASILRHWSTRPLTLSIGGAVGIAWVLLMPRFLALLVLALFVACVSVPSLRRSRYLCLGVVAAALIATLSPLDVIFVHVAGGPKILECCPGAPYTNLRAAEELQHRGVCLVCGDLAGPNRIARWYLVW
jgi:hypothetical protein